MNINSNHSYNNINFGAQLKFYNDKSRQAIEKLIPPRRLKNIIKKFELATTDYPNDTLTLTKQGVRCQIYNGYLYSYKDETILDFCNKLSKLQGNKIVEKLLKLYNYYRGESDVYAEAFRYAETQAKMYIQSPKLMPMLIENFRLKRHCTETKKCLLEDNVFRWLRSTGHSYITYKNGNKISALV